MKRILIGLALLIIFGHTTVGHTASFMNSKKISISVEEAVSIFQTEYPNTDITSLELDRSFGKYYYEIEGVDDSIEYKLTIDAKNKKVKNKEQELLDVEDQGSEQKKIDFSTIISTKQASNIAINHIGKGKTTDWKLDKNLSTTYWEVTVKKIGKTSKVSIDAISGKVLAVEEDD